MHQWASEVKGQLQSMLEENKCEKIVESIEDEKAESSVVIERGLGLSAAKAEEEASKRDSKNLYEVELSHSQSENVIHYKRESEEELEFDLPLPADPDPATMTKPPGI